MGGSSHQTAIELRLRENTIDALTTLVDNYKQLQDVELRGLVVFYDSLEECGWLADTRLHPNTSAQIERIRTRLEFRELAREDD